MTKQKLDPVAIGKKLVELRGIRTRVGVAKELGISTSALCFYESGQRIPPDPVKLRISEYYKVPIQKIFFE